MNPFDAAEPMGQLAAKIAKEGHLDAAAIVTVDSGKICFFFGGENEIDEEHMQLIVEACGKGLAELAEKIKSGEIKPEPLSESCKSFNAVHPPKDNPWNFN